MSDDAMVEGVIVNQGKQLASIPGGGGYGQIIPIRTTDRARELARRRWDKAAQAVRAGVAKAGEQIPDVDRRSAPAVLEHLAEQHALHAADPSAKGAASSFALLLRAGWPAPDKGETAPGPASGDTDLAELVAAWRAAKAADPALAERARRLLAGDDT